jgi:cytochrome b561
MREIRPGRQHAPTAEITRACMEIIRWASPMSVAIVGVLGVVHDALPNEENALSLELHLGFGFLLWLYVISQFALPTKWRAFKRAIGRQARARALSRGVYLLMYGLAGIKLICYLLARYWPDLVLGVGPSNDSLPSSIAQAMTQLQCYVVYGVVAIITTRILALWPIDTTTIGGPLGWNGPLPRAPVPLPPALAITAVSALPLDD